MDEAAGGGGGGRRDGGLLAYIGIGSNLGDPRAQVEAALEALGRLGPLRASSLYRTEPLGPAQPWFVNAVAELRTGLEPRALLGELQAIERRAGRGRDVVRWGPRVLDLDLLLHGDREIREPGLIVPHPGLLQRRFVLVPLAELAPGLRLPGTAAGAGPVVELLAALRDPLRVERLGAPPRAAPAGRERVP